MVGKGKTVSKHHIFSWQISRNYTEHCRLYSVSDKPPPKHVPEITVFNVRLYLQKLVYFLNNIIKYVCFNSVHNIHVNNVTR
jgi:hypothetical protein